MAVVYITHDLPKLDHIEDYRPPLASRVFDSEGHVIAEFAIEKRTLVDVGQLPAHVRYAFIAAEDADFYNHTGIDYTGLFRAMINEVKYKLVGGQRIGGSTITQQTAKLMLLTNKKTYTRKIKEMILAHRIEEALNKDEILNIYLNQIYFGNGAYGIEEAARTYYGVSAKSLTLGQAAALAAAPKSPNRLNPIADPERVRVRRDYVLDQMVIHKFTSQVYAQAARKESVRGKAVANPYLDIAPYFTEEIRRQLVEKFGEEAVFYQGLNIYTSLNSDMQRAANASMAYGLREVDKRQGYRGPLMRPDNASLATLKEQLAARRKTLFELPQSKSQIWDLRNFVAYSKELGIEAAVGKIGIQKLDTGVIVAGIVKSVSNPDKTATIDLGSTDGILSLSKMAWARQFNLTRYTNPPSQPGDVLKTGDIVYVKVESAGQAPSLSLEQEPLVGGALVSLDAKSGSVLAMVGGFDFRTLKFNRATQAKRQPGSSFKPFVYSTAIEREKVTAATIITDAPKVFFEATQDGDWKPKNHTGKYLGDITVRTCLTRSVNTCSISILERIGINALRDTAAKVGLLTDRTPFPRDLTLALGTAEVIPIDMVNAYRVFPNGGTYSPYVLIDSVKDQKGKLLFEANTEATQVLRPQTAYITTNILRGLMRGLTANSASGLSQELAGKTGTTNQMRSAWFLGYSRDIVTGVYVGFDDNKSLGVGEYGFKAAFPIWTSFMSSALAQRPARPFDVPEGLVWRLIDQRTGMLATSDAGMDSEALGSTTGDEDADTTTIRRGVVLEAFIPGTEPRTSQSESPPPPLEMMESGGSLP